MSCGTQKMSLALKEEKSKCKGPGVRRACRKVKPGAGEFRTLETGPGYHCERQCCTGARTASSNRRRPSSVLVAGVAFRIVGW